MPLQILIIGDQHRAEALPLTEWMSATFQSANVLYESDITLALRKLQETHLIPDLVVVIESHPDEYSSPQIDQLTILAPLARWVVCYGDWSESAGRTRDIWPMAVRIPMRSAQQRLQQEWNLLCGKFVSPLPMSGSREEVFGADYQWRPQQTQRATVLVDSPDPEYWRYLFEFLTDCGHAVVAAEDESPDVILFDLDPWGDMRQQVLALLQDQYPGVPVIGLMSLPLPSLVDELEIQLVPKLGNQQAILDAMAQA
jgi:hypothetical protein